MTLSTSSWLIGGGVLLVLLGILIRWRTARYDLKDAAIDSAWTLARGKRTAENPTALEQKFNDIRTAPTWTGRATRTAGTVAGHFIAQALAVVSLALILGGALLVGAGLCWR